MRPHCSRSAREAEVIRAAPARALRHRHVGHDRHAVASDFCKTLADGEIRVAAVAANDQLAGHHLRQQRHVVGEHADLAA